jgi:hypothetical protein
LHVFGKSAAEVLCVLQESPPDFTSREAWYSIPFAPGKNFSTEPPEDPSTREYPDTPAGATVKREDMLAYAKEMKDRNEPSTYRAQYEFIRKVLNPLVVMR